MFSIAVIVDDIEKRRRSAGTLHVVIGFFLVAKSADYFKHMEYQQFLPVAPVLLVACLSFFYGFFRKKWDAGSKFNGRLRILQLLTFLALAFVFFRLSKPIDAWICIAFGALTLFLLASERKIFEPSCLMIDENGVQVPGAFRQHTIPWEDLSQVVVREDFVTLFHIRKKYLQFQVTQDLSTLEVAKMNAFCRQYEKDMKEGEVD